MAFPIPTMQESIIPGLTLPESHHNWGWNNCQRKSQMKEDLWHILRMLNDAGNALYSFDLEIQKNIQGTGRKYSCRLSKTTTTQDITEHYWTLWYCIRCNSGDQGGTISEANPVQVVVPIVCLYCLAKWSSRPQPAMAEREHPQHVWGLRMRPKGFKLEFQGFFGKRKGFTISFEIFTKGRSGS